ncbi:sensor histidine kinase [Gudongella sp. SC589]|jgi:signal transduction histidine kinase|uniref:sensor histidine kinase n=1 Tax=Gudongella sp. SC589 TaxID=3385990 RepID=UPI0039046EC7
MRKISHKLILGMLLVTILSVGILWVYQRVFLEGSYMNSRVEILKATTEQLSELYDDTEAFLDNAESVFMERNIATEVSTIDGRIIYSTGNTMGRGQAAGFRVLRGEYLEDLLRTGEATTTMVHQRQSTELFTYSKLLEDGDTVITTSLPIEPINETVQILERQLLIISAILVVVSILIGTFFSRFFLRPIKNLNKSVNELAAGDMEARVDVEAEDEIGELAVNFNKMAEQISKVDRLRKDLVANVSHELRTPLGLIRGYAEMSRDIHQDDPVIRRENLDIIIEESERLGRMVDEILDMSRIQSGNMELWQEDVDMMDLARSAVNKYSIVAESKNIKLDVMGERESFYVWADRRRMEQVFHNLVSNAIAHTENGNVDIVLTERDNVLRVDVRDTGSGIPQDEIEHIWDRYYKVNSSNRVSGGSGIGLSITKAIFESHDIKYGVESIPGKGSDFYFEIPINK